MDAGEKGAGPKLAEDVMKFKQAWVNGGSNFRRLSLQFWLRRPSRNSRERLPFLYLGKRLPQFWALRRDCKNRRSGGWVAPGFGPDSAGGMDGWMDGWDRVVLGKEQLEWEEEPLEKILNGGASPMRCC